MHKGVLCCILLIGRLWGLLVLDSEPTAGVVACVGAPMRAGPAVCPCPAAPRTRPGDVDHFRDATGVLSSDQLGMQNLILPSSHQTLLEMHPPLKSFSDPVETCY